MSSFKTLLPFGQKSLRSVSFESEDTESDRFIFVVVLSLDRRRVLLTRHGESNDVGKNELHWRLPMFVYMGGLGESSYRLLSDLCATLGMDGDVECDDGAPFSVGPDYFGSAAMVTDGHFGLTSLTVVYCHRELDVELPENFRWADHSFVGEIREYIGEIMEENSDLELVHRGLGIVRELIGDDGEMKLNSLKDQRYRPDWYNKTKNWFRDSVRLLSGSEVCGPVVQHTTSVTSTLLKIWSTKGCYFLKAPCIGSVELATTVAVSKLIGRSVVAVESFDEQLGCFLMKELEQPDKLYEYSYLSTVLETLGKVQIASAEHVDDLLRSGVPDRSPEKFVEALEGWVKDEGLQKALGYCHKYLVEAQPMLEKMCKRLKESEIPSMLVHGDFDTRNVGLNMSKENGEDEEVVIFDWQFGCVSHPFSDMRELFCFYDGYDDDFSKEESEERRMENEALFESRERYFAHFKDKFGVSEDDLKEEFQLGRHYGVCLVFWSTIQCLPSSEFQYRSRILEFLSTTAQRIGGMASKIDAILQG